MTGLQLRFFSGRLTSGKGYPARAHCVVYMCAAGDHSDLICSDQTRSGRERVIGRA